MSLVGLLSLSNVCLGSRKPTDPEEKAKRKELETTLINLFRGGIPLGNGEKNIYTHVFKFTQEGVTLVDETGQETKVHTQPEETEEPRENE